MEILYKDSQKPLPAVSGGNIRWLDVEEYETFCQHLSLCGQKAISRELWRGIYGEGARYCGAFLEGKMIARACVEKYSDSAWEAADVRTAKSFRNRGLASQCCFFVLAYIRRENRLATMRTEDDNLAMQRVIAKLGFEKMT